MPRSVDSSRRGIIDLAVAGATGRMGQRVLALAAEDARFRIVAALTEDGDPHLGKPMAWGAASVTPDRRRTQPCDVLIDFSTPDGTIEHLRDCVRDRVPMVIGTTGHDTAQRTEIQQASSEIALLQASNFSLGVNLLLSLVGRVAQVLGSEYDVEIVEGHHRRKVDAPSGTAISLLDAILSQTGRSREQHAVFGREGQIGQRPPGQIGVHAVRMGDIVGEHEVHFAGPGETVTLKHSALSRDTFAMGALRAAAWLAGKPAGRYSMAQVLGLESAA